MTVQDISIAHHNSTFTLPPPPPLKADLPWLVPPPPPADLLTPTTLSSSAPTAVRPRSPCLRDGSSSLTAGPRQPRPPRSLRAASATLRRQPVLSSRGNPSLCPLPLPPAPSPSLPLPPPAAQYLAATGDIISVVTGRISHKLGEGMDDLGLKKLCW